MLLTLLKTTIGIPILIILLRITTGLISYTPLGKPPQSIQSGHYGSPPNAWWWLKQSLIYFIGLFGMKICVLIIFLMIPGISQIGDWALRWTEGNEKLQIAFSMMIFPLIMNALQYYIIDSFIKEKESTDHQLLPSDDSDDHGRVYDAAVDGQSDSESEDSGHRNQRLKMQARAQVDPSEEYDPSVDGAAGGSSSREPQRRPTGHIPPKLYPKE
jgi:hypothetical protein